jgi:hypothetical protein
LSLGVGFAGSQLTASELTDGLDSLNNLIKSWQNYHLPWLSTNAVLFFDANKRIYRLGDAADKQAMASDFREATVDADVAPGGTTITCDTTQFSVNDNVGVELDSGIRFWSTAAVIDAVAGTIQLNNALPSASSTGRSMSCCTNFISLRPLSIDYASKGVYSQSTDEEITLYLKDTYLNIVDKKNTGEPTIAYYNAQLGAGELFVYLVPDSCNYYANLSYKRGLEIVTDQNQTLDFPDEFVRALIPSLAVLMSSEYSTSAERTASVMRSADENLGLALSNAVETGSEPLEYLYGQS